MYIRGWCICAVALSVALSGLAPEARVSQLDAVKGAHAQVVQTSKGPIEFVGLEQWSPARIQEALGYETPDSLHYCAGELKKRLGFPDASVFTFRPASGQYKVITVVEPQHAHRVRYADLPTGTFAPTCHVASSTRHFHC